MRTDARRGHLAPQAARRLRGTTPGARAARALLVATLGCAWLLACGTRVEQTASEMPTATIIVGNNQLGVEVAVTRAHRGRGLMFRESLSEDRGMLFIFPEERVREFWMRNTTIPLAIAFADASGRIVNIAEMRPLSEAPVTSVAPARYALEVNSGWFARHGVQIGDDLRELPQLRVE